MVGGVRSSGWGGVYGVWYVVYGGLFVIRVRPFLLIVCWFTSVDQSSLIQAFCFFLLFMRFGKDGSGG